jgi:hypothetical protein
MTTNHEPRTTKEATMTNEPQSTVIRVPRDAPPAYWDGWAEIRLAIPTMTNDPNDSMITLRTYRTGADGESDARYIRDRLASGLYFAEILA